MKTVLAQLRQYKKDSLLTMGFTMLEVIMEVLLPFVTAMIIDEGLERSDLSAVARLGVIMLVMAAVSLISGAMAGKASSRPAHLPALPATCGKACM